MSEASTRRARPGQPRRVRADAQENLARILEAAQRVFTDDPGASLTTVAEAAGVARSTVHRHFSSRESLLEALIEDLNARYLHAFDQARDRTAPPMVALHRLTELALELKVAHPFVLSLTPTVDSPGAPASNPAIHERLDQLFARLHAAGEIGINDPAWCRNVYLALLHEVYELPIDSPALAAYAASADEIGARVQLLITSLIGALQAPAHPHRR